MDVKISNGILLQSRHGLWHICSNTLLMNIAMKFCSLLRPARLMASHMMNITVHKPRPIEFKVNKIIKMYIIESILRQGMWSSQLYSFKIYYIYLGLSKTKFNSGIICVFYRNHSYFRRLWFENELPKSIFTYSMQLFIHYSPILVK